MAQAIVKKMSYDARNPIGLGGGCGTLTPLEPSLTKSQLEDWKLYHHIETHGLGYDPDTPLKQLTQWLKSWFADQASIFRVHEDIDLPIYLFEESLVKDPGSSSNWYDFSNDEEELSDGTDMWSSSPKEPSSSKEVPYFDLVSTGDWEHIIANIEKITNQEDPWRWAKPWSENVIDTLEGFVKLEAFENIVEESPSNPPTEDLFQKIDFGPPDNSRLVFISKNIKDN